MVSRWWRMWRRTYTARSASTDALVVTGQGRRGCAQSRSSQNSLYDKLRCVHNPDFATGEMLSSLKVGLGRAAGCELAAAHSFSRLICPA